MKKLGIILLLAFLLVGCANEQNIKDVDNQNFENTGNAEVSVPEDSGVSEEPTEPPHEHAYTESTTAGAACETEGVKTFTCECGNTYTEAIPAMGHVFEEVADSGISATCAADGKEADTKCANCESLVEGAVIPATGHSFGEYVYNNDATKKADGTETATCTVCAEKTSRSKTGTRLPVESCPYALNTPWYDATTDQVYFYTLGTADPTSEPYPTAFNMAREMGLTKHVTRSYTMSTWVGKFNEFVDTYTEGDVYLSGVRIEYEFK